MAISEKVAIVTGSAGGIGQALVRDLVAQGYKVAVAEVNIEAGTKLAEELAPATKFFYMDVASYSSQAKAFQEVWDTWGRLDAVLGNAGIGDRSPLYILQHRGKKEVPPEPDTACTDVVFKGVMYNTVLATHFMRQNKNPGGKIVVTCSAAALYPHECFPEYDGAKAAVLNWVRAAAPVLKLKDNITLNAVLPGMVPTPMLPDGMRDSIDPTWLTPVSTIVGGYNIFLKDDTGLTGKTVECSQDKYFYAELPPYLNGIVSKAVVEVYEPLFKTVHGEISNLPDAKGAEAK